MTFINFPQLIRIQKKDEKKSQIIKNEKIKIITKY